MPGYHETYLQGLNRAIPMARLAEQERQNAFRQQFQARQMQGQDILRTENARRMQEGLEETKRHHGASENLGMQNLIARLQSQLNQGTWQPMLRDGETVMFNSRTMQILDPKSGKITSATEGGSSLSRVQPMPVKMQSELSGIGDDYRKLLALAKSFKPEYTNALGPQMGRAENIIKQYVPGTDSAQPNWWREFEALQNIPARHAAFGGSLTKTEQPLWERGAANVGMKPEDVVKMLNVRAALLGRALERRAKGASSRYSREEVEGAAGISTPEKIDMNIPDLEALAVEGSRRTGRGRPPIEQILGDR